MEHIINIDENYRIFIEPNNYTLQSKKTKKEDGAVYWRTEGYYPNLTQLATAYLNDAPARSQQAIDTFGKLIDIYKTAEKNIINAIERS